MSLRIGFDIDGVLADFRTAFRADGDPHASAATSPTTAGSRQAAGAALAGRRAARVGRTSRRTPNWWMEVAGLRAGADRAALQPDARGRVGGLLHDQAAAERRATPSSSRRSGGSSASASTCRRC